MELNHRQDNLVLYISVLSLSPKTKNQSNQYAWGTDLICSGDSKP